MKKKSLVFLELFSILILNIQIVFAQQQNSLLDSLQRTLKFIFVDIGSLAKSDEQLFIVYFKLLLFFLVFGIIYYALRKALHETTNRIAVVIALIISLITVIFLPKNLVLLIFRVYGGIGIALLILLPAIVGFLLTKNVFTEDNFFHRLMRFLIYVAIGLITLLVVFSLRNVYAGEGISGGADTTYYDLTRWLEIGGIIAFIAALLALVGKLGGSGRGSGGPAGLSGEPGKTLEKGVKKEKKDVGEEKKETKKEKKFLKTLRKIEKRAFGANNDIINDLSDLKKIMSKYGLTQTGRKLIVKKIEQIKPDIKKERDYIKQIDEYKSALTRLENTKIIEVLNNYRETQISYRLAQVANKYGLKTKQGKQLTATTTILRDYITNVKNEVMAEYNTIKSLDTNIKNIERLEQYFVNLLTDTINEINKGNILVAQQRIDEAIETKEEQAKDLEKVINITERVQAIEKHELGDLSDEKKLLEIVKKLL